LVYFGLLLSQVVLLLTYQVGNSRLCVVSKFAFDPLDVYLEYLEPLLKELVMRLGRRSVLLGLFYLKSGLDEGLSGLPLRGAAALGS